MAQGTRGGLRKTASTQNGSKSHFSISLITVSYFTKRGVTLQKVTSWGRDFTKSDPLIRTGSRPIPASASTNQGPEKGGVRIPGFGFRVSGFGLWVSSFGFQVSGCRFRVSGFRFRISGCGFWVKGNPLKQAALFSGVVKEKRSAKEMCSFVI